MYFDEALHELRNGFRLARAEWAGKQWVALGGIPTMLHADKFWNRHTKQFAKMQPDEFAMVNPYFVVKTPQDTIQMGWAPSQQDILADDWGLVT